VDAKVAIRTSAAVVSACSTMKLIDAEDAAMW
jgi:hypothetical protein